MKYFLISLLIILVVYIVYNRGTLYSTHVINLDKSVDRYNKFLQNTAPSGLKVVRWPAINGAALGNADLLRYNVPRNIYEKYASDKRLGVIGCYLSHATLLRYLAAAPARPNDYHLILEDDAVVPTDTGAAIASFIARLPSDWDILQLYNNRPNTAPYSGPIHTLLDGTGNWGNVAYVVRHGALQKINAHLAIMRLPVDNQMLEKAQIWKWFCCVPNYVSTDDGGVSTLNDSK